MRSVAHFIKSLNQSLIAGSAALLCIFIVGTSSSNAAVSAQSVTGGICRALLKTTAKVLPNALGKYIPGPVTATGIFQMKNSFVMGEADAHGHTFLKVAPEVQHLVSSGRIPGDLEFQMKISKNFLGEISVALGSRVFSRERGDTISETWGDSFFRTGIQFQIVTIEGETIDILIMTSGGNLQRSFSVSYLEAGSRDGRALVLGFGSLRN